MDTLLMLPLSPSHSLQTYLHLTFHPTPISCLIGCISIFVIISSCYLQSVATTTLAVTTTVEEHCLHRLVLGEDNTMHDVINYLPFILLVIIPLIVFYISIQTAQLKMQEVRQIYFLS